MNDYDIDAGVPKAIERFELPEIGPHHVMERRLSAT